MSDDVLTYKRYKRAAYPLVWRLLTTVTWMKSPQLATMVGPVSVR